ncbi:MAG: hypothetical protein QM689_04850 [Oscillospiraceae bacterium]
MKKQENFDVPKKKKRMIFRLDLLLFLAFAVIIACFVYYMCNTSLDDIL